MAGATAANGAVSETLDEAGDDLSIVAAASEHADVVIAAIPDDGQHGAMPETIDCGVTAGLISRVSMGAHCVPKGPADQVDGTIERKRDQRRCEQVRH